MSTKYGTITGGIELDLDNPAPLTAACAQTEPVAARLLSVNNDGDAGCPTQRDGD